MKFDLNRMVRVMRRLGDPQDSFPSIHVAGTNGKGSVTAMIAGVLREAGLSVGMYTSPHLEKANERFQVNGRMIPNSDLKRLSSSVRRLFPHLTEFEFFTVIAFLWFAEKQVDVAVLETGLGGRLDATNIVRRVLVGAITNIDYDHTEWLGNTLGKIAREKAGIIKPGVPLVTGARGEALRVIESVARKRKAPVETVSPKRLRAARLTWPLEGSFQSENAAVALAALESLRRRGLVEISNSQIRRGFAHVRWPGRFERIRPGVILDGAHNPAGCRMLVRTLNERGLAPVNFLFGALKDKDVEAMARILAPAAAACVTAPVPSDRSAPAKTLANLKAWSGKARPARSIAEGWKMLKKIKNKRPLVIAGSLYLVGEMRRRLR